MRREYCEMDSPPFKPKKIRCRIVYIAPIFMQDEFDEMKVLKSVFEGRVEFMEGSSGRWIEFDTGVGFVLGITPSKTTHTVDLRWVQVPSPSMRNVGDQILAKLIAEDGLFEPLVAANALSSSSCWWRGSAALLPLLAAAERTAEEVVTSVQEESRLREDKDEPATSCALPPHTLSSAPAPVITLTVLRLDHIRSFPRYSRSLRQIAESVATGEANPLSYFHVTLVLGNEVASHKDRKLERHWGHIFVAVESEAPEATKKFLRDWREEFVDVDSRGKGCKERMMTFVGECVLSGAAVSTSRIPSIFSIWEGPDVCSWVAEKKFPEGLLGLR